MGGWDSYLSVFRVILFSGAGLFFFGVYIASCACGPGGDLGCGDFYPGLVHFHVVGVGIAGGKSLRGGGYAGQVE